MRSGVIRHGVIESLEFTALCWSCTENNFLKVLPLTSDLFQQTKSIFTLLNTNFIVLKHEVSVFDFYKVVSLGSASSRTSGYIISQLLKRPAPLLKTVSHV